MRRFDWAGLGYRLLILAVVLVGAAAILWPFWPVVAEWMRPENAQYKPAWANPYPWR